MPSRSRGNKKNIKIFCKCGCGKKLWKYSERGSERKFLPDHWQQTIVNKLISCNCGCGEKFWKYNKWSQKREFIRGHKHILKRNEKYSKQREESKKLLKKILRNDIIIGTILSGGSFENSSTETVCFRIKMKKEQKEFLQKLSKQYSILGIKSCISEKQERFRTESHLVFKKLKKMFDSNGQRKIPKRISLSKKMIEIRDQIINIRNSRSEKQKKIIRNAMKKRFEKEQREKIEKLKKNPIRMKALKHSSILDGVILSDGSISREKKFSNSRFSVSQKKSNEAFLDEIADYLEGYLEFGVTWGDRDYFDKRTGKIYEGWNIGTTNNGVFFTKLRKRWYRGKKKIIPNNLKLDAESLAWWFMGDGYNHDGHHVRFATESFSNSDVNKLVLKLHKLGLKSAHRVMTNGTPRLVLSGPKVSKKNFNKFSSWFKNSGYKNKPRIFSRKKSQIWLSTFGLIKKNREKLVKKLQKNGYRVKVLIKKLPIISIDKSYEINDFYEMIEDFILLPTFKYKIIIPDPQTVEEHNDAQRRHAGKKAEEKIKKVKDPKRKKWLEKTLKTLKRKDRKDPDYYALRDIFYYYLEWDKRKANNAKSKRNRKGKKLSYKRKENKSKRADYGTRML